MQWKTLLHVAAMNVDSVLDSYMFVLLCCVFILSNWSKSQIKEAVYLVY